jgi:hypothetical protein
MSVFLTIIPALVVLSTVLMYRLTGQRQILKMDLIQFIYAFVISPVMFVWLKTFLFVILRQELDLRLTLAEVFIIDGIFSVLFLYIFAFVVIHSLTKTFNLHREVNPMYDLYEHSEYFHQLFSHFAIYVGSLLLCLALAAVNIWIPLSVSGPKSHFYGLIASGLAAGLIGFVGVWSYDTHDRRFYQIMKVAFGVMFVVLVWLYLIANPEFDARYGVYWFVFAMSFMTTLLSLFGEKADDNRWWDRLPFVINWRQPVRYFNFVTSWLRGRLASGQRTTILKFFKGR